MVQRRTPRKLPPREVTDCTNKTLTTKPQTCAPNSQNEPKSVLPKSHSHRCHRRQVVQTTPTLGLSRVQQRHLSNRSPGWPPPTTKEIPGLISATTERLQTIDVKPTPPPPPPHTHIPDTTHIHTHTPHTLPPHDDKSRASGTCKNNPKHRHGSHIQQF